jgi:CRISPR-associated protein Csb2
MSAAASLFGEDAIPSSLSGHGLPNGNRHQHAFYLPLDSNGDGRIDRVIVHVPLGMGMRERQVLERVVRLWSAGGAQWRVVMESMGDTAAGGAVMRKATEWYSITPYLHPWYVKKGLGMEDQIRRECRERGLPEPVALERFESVCVGNGRRSLRPIQFQRFRKKRGLNQPDRRGSFWKLTFAEPVRGPLALGFGCHFGLGLFAPDTMRALSCV